MKLFRNSLLLIAGLFLLNSAVLAQGQQMPPKPMDPADITDEQLESFSVISAQIQVAQEEANAEAKVAVEEAGMDFARFQEIAMMSRNPQMADSLNMTEEEQKAIQEVQPKLMKINGQMRQQIMGFIQEEEMSPQTFQQIARAVQQNKELQVRLQSLTEDEG